MTASEPIHPGEHLAEILSELGITQYGSGSSTLDPWGEYRIPDLIVAFDGDVRSWKNSEDTR